MSASLRFLSLNGMLGYGYPLDSLNRGIAAGPAFVGVDAGSVDPGPHYLGSGRSFVRPDQVRRDLAPALRATRQRGIPLVIGTAGGSGAGAHVDGFLEILRDVSRKFGLH